MPLSLTQRHFVANSNERRTFLMPNSEVSQIDFKDWIPREDSKSARLDESYKIAMSITKKPSIKS